MSAAGLVAIGVVVVALASEPSGSIGDQIEALNDELLGDSVATDPAELRARNEEYEERFAALGTPAEPDPSKIRPHPEKPFVPELGIFAPAEDILSGYDFGNYWVGRLDDGRVVNVYAGAMDDDPKQGGVVVIVNGQAPSGFIPTPDRDGAVVIETADHATLTLRTQTGSAFVFDATRTEFV
jgi:hypothetical protein